MTAFATPSGFRSETLTANDADKKRPGPRKGSGLCAQGENRTRMPRGAAPSRRCVYQFHHLSSCFLKRCPSESGRPFSRLILAAQAFFCVFHMGRPKAPLYDSKEDGFREKARRRPGILRALCPCNRSPLSMSRKSEISALEACAALGNRRHFGVDGPGALKQGGAPSTRSSTFHEVCKCGQVLFFCNKIEADPAGPHPWIGNGWHSDRTIVPAQMTGGIEQRR